MNKLFEVLESTVGKIGLIITLTGLIGSGAVTLYKFQEERATLNEEIEYLKEEIVKVQKIENLDEEVKKIEQYKVLFTIALDEKDKQIDSLSKVIKNESEFRKTIVRCIKGETDTWYWNKYHWSREDTLSGNTVVKVELTNDQNYWYFNDKDEVFKAFYEKKEKMFKYVDPRTKKVAWIPTN